MTFGPVGETTAQGYRVHLPNVHLLNSIKPDHFIWESVNSGLDYWNTGILE